MKKGEKARFKIRSDYAYGEKGNSEKNVPPNTALTYEIELVDFTKEKPAWEMTNEEKLENSTKTKDAGNELFKQGKFGRAVNKYKKAMKVINIEHSMSDEQKQQAKQLKVTCHINMAACDLKLKDYKSCIADCNKVRSLWKWPSFFFFFFFFLMLLLPFSPSLTFFFLVLVLGFICF